MSEDKRRVRERKPKADDVYGTFKTDKARLQAFRIREIRIGLVWLMIVLGGQAISPRLMAVLDQFVM